MYSISRIFFKTELMGLAVHKPVFARRWSKKAERKELVQNSSFKFFKMA